MSQYLLDSNAVIALLKKKPSPIHQRVLEYDQSTICISSIVAHELYYGAFKGRHPDHNVNIVDRMKFEVLDFDREDARSAGEIRAILALKGMTIGAYDVLIAGQARARGLILVTHNTRELNRVVGLQIEDWEME